MFEGLETVSQIFLYVFIGAGVLTFLYVLFGDALDGLFEFGEGFLNPTVILSFITFFSGTSFILLYSTGWSLLGVCVLALVFSMGAVTLIYVFILRPVSQAEQNTAYRLDDFIGSEAPLTVGIPENGLGLVSIKRPTGYFSQPAKTADGSNIPNETIVRITAIDKQVFIVERTQEEN